MERQVNEKHEWSQECEGFTGWGLDCGLYHDELHVIRSEGGGEDTYVCSKCHTFITESEEWCGVAPKEDEDGRWYFPIVDKK